MTIAYWIVAALLAALYLFSGGKKAVQSQEQLAPMMAWAGTSVPMPGVRLIGVVEILGAAGLILPPATGVAIWLAVVAAVGLFLLQCAAFGFHLRREETKDLWLNVVLALLAAAAAWLVTAF